MQGLPPPGTSSFQVFRCAVQEMERPDNPAIWGRPPRRSAGVRVPPRGPSLTFAQCLVTQPVPRNTQPSLLFPAFHGSPPAFIVHCSEEKKKKKSSHNLRLEFNLENCGSLKGLHPSFSPKIILGGKKDNQVATSQKCAGSIIPRLSLPPETQFSIANCAEVGGQGLERPFHSYHRRQTQMGIL